ncbi:MAG: hypothetical protein ACHQO8_06775, partial [Vicinamibacterales bacterium]
MALAQLTLDDLTWSGMVDAARRRIITASNGAWTLHAPVDPGVTMLELFAWLLEQRLYWLDQVPDALLRGVLTLLDQAPHPSRAAVTVFGLTDESHHHPYVVIPAGSAMQLDGQLPPVVFTTNDAVALLPMSQADTSVVAFGIDRSVDLAQGRAVRLLPADGTAAELRIVLRLSSLPAGPVAAPFSLLFELVTSPDIHPSWSYDAATGVDAPAALTWWYQSTNGLVPFAQVADGTAGLRRSGVVRLAVPTDWAPDPGPASDRYSIVIKTERSTFSSSPRLLQIVPNVVTASHRLPVTRNRRVVWLPLPGNTIELDRDAVPPLESTVTVDLVERVAGRQTWTPVEDLTFSGPADRVFVVDRAAGLLRFGDGLTGRVPVLDQTPNTASNVYLAYDAGGGASGNLGSGFTWHATQAAFDLSAVNVVPAAEGQDPEPLADARDRAAASIHATDRAVIAADYETLAVTTPGAGVKRARAAVGVHPLHACLVPGAVTVFIVPDVPGDDGALGFDAIAVPDPVADPGVLAAVRRRLDAARMVGTEVFVSPTTYARPSIVIDVVGDVPAPSDLAGRVTGRLRAFLDPLHGGDDASGWPFGEPLRPSALIREGQAAVGTDAHVSGVSIELDGRVESCVDVAIGAHQLVA